MARSREVPLVVAGAALIACTYGLARYGYGLFLPSFRADFALTSTTSGLLATGAFGLGTLRRWRRCRATLLGVVVVPRSGARRRCCCGGGAPPSQPRRMFAVLAAPCCSWHWRRPRVRQPSAPPLDDVIAAAARCGAQQSSMRHRGGVLSRPLALALAGTGVSLAVLRSARRSRPTRCHDGAAGPGGFLPRDAASVPCATRWAQPVPAHPGVPAGGAGPLGRGPSARSLSSVRPGLFRPPPRPCSGVLGAAGTTGAAAGDVVAGLQRAVRRAVFAVPARGHRRSRAVLAIPSSCSSFCAVSAGPYVAPSARSLLGGPV